MTISGYLCDKVKSIFNNHRFLFVVAFFFLVVVCVRLLCGTLGLASNSFLELTTFFSYLAGLFGSGYLIFILVLLFAKQNVLDRNLAEFRLTSVFKILVFIFCVPFSIALFLSCFGISAKDLLTESGCLDKAGEDPDIFWTTFYHFTDPGNQHMVGSVLGRRVAFWISLLGMFLMNGFLVTTIISFIDRHISGWNTGEVRYNFWRSSHIIIIGGHVSVASIIKDVLDKDHGKYKDVKYVVIMTNQNIEQYRTTLKSELEEYQFEKVILYHGSRNSREDVLTLHVEYETVKAVYIVGEGTAQEKEPSHDSLNLNSAKLVASFRPKVPYIEEKKERPSDKLFLDCYVMFETQSSFAAFQLTDISDDLKSRLNFHPYNKYEMSAQKVLANPSAPYRAIDIHYDEDGNPVAYMDEQSNRRVHLVIVGMTRMSLAMGQEAALIAHYPNYVREELNEEKRLKDGETNVGSDKGKLRTLITYIDSDAHRQMQYFQSRTQSLFDGSRWSYRDATQQGGEEFLHDGLNDENLIEYQHLREKRLADKTFLDVEWEFIKGETSDPLVKEYLSRCSQNENDILTVIICMPTDDQALTVSTNLPQAVYDKAEQILVYQRHSQDMILQLSAAGIEDKSVRKKNRYQKVVAFGELIHCFDQSLVDVPFAKKINSNNQKQIAQSIAEGKDWREIDLKWCNLKLLERWSAIYSSHGWWSRFRTMGIAPGQTPQKELFEEYFQQNEHTKMLYCRVEHNRWNMERLLKVGDCLLTDAHYEEWSAQSALPEKGSPRDQFKKALKDGPTREHLDLCSFWQLCVKDSGTIKYDLNRNERLVGIYEALF